MGRDDWYRSPVWDASARDEFESRLKRARSGRGQYLLIKGSALIGACGTETQAAGRDLLQRCLDEHDDEAITVVRAHHALGRSCAAAGMFDDAAEQFQAVLRMEDAGLAVATGAELDLAEVIEKAGWADRLDEAATCLHRYWQRRPVFPASNFRALVVEARLAHSTRHHGRAKELAEQALALLKENASPFSAHPGIGLVTTDAETYRELEVLAG